MRANGECSRLDAGGTVLGAFPHNEYAQGEIQLQEGDRVLFFTDGLSEAVDKSNEQFGEERLIDLLRRHRHRAADELKEIVFDAVAEFCGHSFRDDAALMMVGLD